MLNILQPSKGEVIQARVCEVYYNGKCIWSGWTARTHMWLRHWTWKRLGYPRTITIRVEEEDSER